MTIASFLPTSVARGAGGPPGSEVPKLRSVADEEGGPHLHGVRTSGLPPVEALLHRPPLGRGVDAEGSVASPEDDLLVLRAVWPGARVGAPHLGMAGERAPSTPVADAAPCPVAQLQGDGGRVSTGPHGSQMALVGHLDHRVRPRVAKAEDMTSAHALPTGHRVGITGGAGVDVGCQRAR